MDGAYLHAHDALNNSAAGDIILIRGKKRLVWECPYPGVMQLGIIY